MEKRYVRRQLSEYITLLRERVGGVTIYLVNVLTEILLIQVCKHFLETKRQKENFFLHGFNNRFPTLEGNNELVTEKKKVLDLIKL